jgi:hypothetical protein
VGEHIKPKYKRKTTTVYFDAFQHDFLDDPLIALTLELTKQFERQGASSTEDRDERIRKFKRAAWAVGKGVARVGLAAATFGATEVLNDVGDEIAQATSKEVESFLSSGQGQETIDSFWAGQRAKVTAMAAFRQALVDLTEPDSEGTPTQKLVIVVDELDRCRPDYALNLLEVIKHFFNVENVHFVLGVNLTELENSVRARYGAGVNAGLYLQKFVTVKMPLSVRDQHLNKDANADHFHNISQSMGIDTKQKTWQYLDLIIKDCPPRSMTLRSIERLTTTLKLSFLGHSFSWKTSGHDLLRAALLVIKVCETDAYQNILHGKIKLSEFRAVFGLFGPPMAQNTGENHITQASEYIFTDPDDRDKTSLGGSHFKPDMFRSYGDDEMKYLNGPQILQKLATEELEVFQLPT